MPSDHREIGTEILNRLEIDTTRLGEALSARNDVVRDCLESDAWDKVPAHCESARKFCAKMWSSGIDPDHAEGIFHAYEGISHLYQAKEAKEKKNSSEERAELAKAVDCLEKSQQSFHFEYRDRWNEVILHLNLGRLYRSQNELDEALVAFQRIWDILDFSGLSHEKKREMVKVVSAEIEKTRMLFRVLPVIDEIAAGKEKPASDDIIGYIQQTDKFEFEFEGQALKVELLKGSQLTFLPEYDYFAMLVRGDSMDQAGISPDDYVVLQKPNRVELSPTHRDIVAVVFRDEDDKATLKRFYFNKPSGSVTLEPESSNPEHKTRVLRPKAFAGDNPPVAVVGIAIAVLKPQSVPIRTLPIVDEIAAGKEKLVSDDIMGHITAFPAAGEIAAGKERAVSGDAVGTTYELAKTFFEVADFDIEIEPDAHHFFWVRNGIPEWRDAGKMPVYCFEEGQPVTGSEVARLVSGVTKESKRGAYAFIIFHERLVDGAVRQLWGLKKRDDLTIIPIHTAEIRQTLLEPRSMPGSPAYWKLVDLKRQWSTLTDPYASVNSLTDPQWFFGGQRQAMIQEILSDITDGVDYFVVYGMRGAGKTTLLNQLALACQEHKYPVAKILCKPLSAQHTYAHVLSEIIQEWGTALEALYPDFAMLSPNPMIEWYSPKTASKSFKENVSELNAAARQYTDHAVKFVLILDEVDHIFPIQESPEEAYHQYCNLTQVLKSILEKPAWPRIFSVVAAMEYPWIHLIDRFPHNKRFQNPLYWRFRLKPIELFQREDWDDMVQTIGELAGLEYTPEGLDVLYHKSAGHPEITRKLCSCLVELRNSGEISSPITAQDAYWVLSCFLDHPTSYAYYLETAFWEDPLSIDLDAEQRLVQEMAKEEGVSEEDLLFELLGRYTGGPGFDEKVKAEKRRPAALLSKLLGRDAGSPGFDEKVKAERRRLTGALRHLVDLQIVAEDKQQGTYAISIPIYRDWIRQEILAMEVEYA